MTCTMAGTARTWALAAARKRGCVSRSLPWRRGLRSGTRAASIRIAPKAAPARRRRRTRPPRDNRRGPPRRTGRVRPPAPRALAGAPRRPRLPAEPEVEGDAAVGGGGPARLSRSDAASARSRASARARRPPAATARGGAAFRDEGGRFREFRDESRRRIVLRARRAGRLRTESGALGDFRENRAGRGADEDAGGPGKIRRSGPPAMRTLRELSLRDSGRHRALRRCLPERRRARMDRPVGAARGGDYALAVKGSQGTL